MRIICQIKYQGVQNATERQGSEFLEGVRESDGFGEIARCVSARRAQCVFFNFFNASGPLGKAIEGRVSARSGRCPQLTKTAS